MIIGESKMSNEQQQQHFLVITIGAQGHINPARRLARRLVRTDPTARVTLTVPILAYRRMFPSADQEQEDGPLAYVPYSDRIEDGLDSAADPSEFKRRISDSLHRIAAGFTARGRPITRIVYALLLSIAADVARDLGVPSTLFWIQSATSFAINYHYFGEYGELVSAHKDEPEFLVELPGLPALRTKELPSLLTNPRPDRSFYSFLYTLYGEVFRNLRREVSAGAKPRVVLNTFCELEAEVIAGFDAVDVLAVGPLVADESSGCTNDLYELDTSVDYVEWLDTKEEGSVVYVSFGSYAALKEGQAEEISKALSESGRPYIWAMATDEGSEDGGLGIRVRWCEQAKVMSHRSVGCFVTHCGWNSMTEALTCGVPMVMMPQWTDQGTNARTAEEEWGVGVRGEANGEGVVGRREIERCLDEVMGEGSETRRKAKKWGEKARAAVGGSSAQNIAKFIKGDYN